MRLPLWDGWQLRMGIRLRGGMGAEWGEKPGGRHMGSARRQGIGDRVGAEARFLQIGGQIAVRALGAVDRDGEPSTALTRENRGAKDPSHTAQS